MTDEQMARVLFAVARRIPSPVLNHQERFALREAAHRLEDFAAAREAMEQARRALADTAEDQ